MTNQYRYARDSVTACYDEFWNSVHTASASNQFWNTATLFSS